MQPIERRGGLRFAPMSPLSQILAHALDAPPSCGSVRVVGIDGRSGSGKTTLARSVAAAWSAPLVSMDEIYPGWHGLAEAVGILVDHVLGPLSEGASVVVPTWDWGRHAPGRRRPLAVGGRLVVEGCGSTAGAASPLIGTRVWLDGPAPVRRRRAIDRDGEAFARHWDMWAAQEEELFSRDGTRARAHLRMEVRSD